MVVALCVALLLGLRHATDPDHLTAVSTLVMAERERGSRVAARLGLSWGAGHALALFVVGVPVVAVHGLLPAVVQRALEFAVGVMIVGLSVRLLVRWRRGYFHAHPHRHGDVVHAHPHMHEGHPHPRAGAHGHRHGSELGRSPLASFAIGVLHGAGGSAGVGILLVGAIPGTGTALAALAVLAAGTAVSMTLLSTAFGYALSRGPLLDRFGTAAPAIGALSLAFGVWYGVAAI